MYGKIFASMYEGTLYGYWKAIVTFQQMIVLSDADGLVDMTPQAIAARTSIPLEIILEGIKLLEQSDQYSRTPGEDGKRIARLDEHRPWGWRIINYHVYRDLVMMEDKRRADRERIAAKRAASRAVSHGVARRRFGGRNVATDSAVSHVSPTVAKVAHAEAEAEAEEGRSGVLEDSDPRPRQARTHKRPAAHEAKEFHAQVVSAYHEALPSLPAIRDWNETRRRKLNTRIAERLAQGKPADQLAYWRDLFAKAAASDFLTGRKADWRCPGLEWLLERANFVKLIEGSYDNHQRAGADGR